VIAERFYEIQKVSQILLCATETPDMGNGLRGFKAEFEIRRDATLPLLNRFGLWEAVKGTVTFHCRKRNGILTQICGWIRPLAIETALPVSVSPYPASNSDGPYHSRFPLCSIASRSLMFSVAFTTALAQ